MSVDRRSKGPYRSWGDTTIVCHEAKCYRAYRNELYVDPTVRCRLVEGCSSYSEHYFLLLSVVLPCEVGVSPEIVEFCYPVEILPSDRDSELVCQIHLSRRYSRIGDAPPPAHREEATKCRLRKVRTNVTYQSPYLGGEDMTWYQVMLGWLARAAIVDARLKIARCFAKYGVGIETTGIWPRGSVWNFRYTEESLSLVESLGAV